MNWSNARRWCAPSASGELDRIEIPQNPLDILAQQMVAACASPEDFGEDELFDLMRSAWPYRTLERGDFDAVLETLSEGIATVARAQRAPICIAMRSIGRVRARRGARLTAITSGGAIPETAQYLVVAEPEGTTVGTLDEDFAVESLAGDVFLLGTTSWRIRAWSQAACAWKMRTARRLRFRSGAAKRRAARSSFRAKWRRLREDIVARPIDRMAACAIAGSIAAGRSRLRYTCAPAARALGALPTGERIVAERFFDEGGGMQLVIHAPFGARINRAWGLALRKRFCRSFNFELQAAATDNGIDISLGEQHSFPLEAVFEFLRPETVEDVLTQALLDAPMFTARWRWNASRALAIPRFSGGKQGSAADSAHARRRPDGRRVSGSGGVPGESDGRDSHSRSSAGERDHRELPARGDGSRRPARGADWAARWDDSSAWRSIRRSLRRFRMRS